MAVDGAVQVGGVVMELSEATGGVNSDGLGVDSVDMDIYLFQFGSRKRSRHKLGGISPAPVIPMGLQTIQQPAIQPPLQPQSGHIAALFFPNAANTLRKEILAEKPVEVLAFIKGI